MLRFLLIPIIALIVINSSDGTRDPNKEKYSFRCEVQFVANSLSRPTRSPYETTISSETTTASKVLVDVLIDAFTADLTSSISERIKDNLCSDTSSTNVQDCCFKYATDNQQKWQSLAQTYYKDIERGWYACKYLGSSFYGSIAVKTHFTYISGSGGSEKYQPMTDLPLDCPHDYQKYTLAPTTTTQKPTTTDIPKSTTLFTGSSGSTTQPTSTISPSTAKPVHKIGDFDCTILADGMYPYKDDIHYYVLCNGGWAYLMKCPVPLVFDIKTHKCNWAEVTTESMRFNYNP